MRSPDWIEKLGSWLLLASRPVIKEPRHVPFSQRNDTPNPRPTIMRENHAARFGVEVRDVSLEAMAEVREGGTAGATGDDVDSLASRRSQAYTS